MIPLALTVLGIPTLASRMGLKSISVSNILFMLLVPLAGAPMISVYGFESNLGNFFYAAVVLGVAYKAWFHGKQEAIRCINYIFFANVILFLILNVVHYSVGISIYDTSTRIALASFASFLVGQRMLVHLLSQFRSHSMYVVMPTVMVLVQAVDSVLFFPMAFGYVLPFGTIVTIAVNGFLIKSALALLSVPFLYVSTYGRN